MMAGRAALILLLATAAVPASAAELQRIHLQMGERDRYYLLHLPAALPPQAVPLVIVLHGGGGGAESAARMSGMSVKADAAGFAVAYPAGSSRLPLENGRTWNSGNCCAYAKDSSVDDVGFIAALIDDVGRQHPIDARRVYVTGLSNGGMLAHRLGCELSERIAAIAPVSGAMGVACHPKRPVSVIMFHGTADTHVPYNGGVGKAALAPRDDPPTPLTFVQWARLDGCSGMAERSVNAPVTHERYAGCANGTEVSLYTIDGYGHQWPGGKPGLRYANVDPPYPGLSATDTMWEFFRTHPKPEGAGTP